MAQGLGKTVATNLRRIRRERRMTQEELAHMAGINRNYPGMIERGQHSPTVEMLERLCRALKIEPTTLFVKSK